MNKLRVAINSPHGPQPSEADVGLHPLHKLQFGKTIPYFRFHLGGECIKDQGKSLHGPEIPAVRADSAIARIELTFKADGIPGESFSNWVCRRELPFFTELLDDFINVAPTDLPELLRDHELKNHFNDLPPATGGDNGIEGQQVNFAATVENEQKKWLRHISRNEWAEALQSNKALLELGIKAIAHACDETLDKVEKPADLIQRLCPGNTLLVDEYHALTKATQEAGPEKGNLQKVFQATEVWLHQVTGQLSTDAPTFMDISDTATPIAFLKIKQILAQDDKHDRVIKFQLQDKTSADYIAHGLETLGHQVVWDQSNAANSRWLLGIKKAPEKSMMKQVAETDSASV